MDIFNIGSNFTKKELKTKFFEKIETIKESTLSDFDKNILIDYYHSNYNRYKLYASDNTQQYVKSSYVSKSYQKKLNPDNTFTIIEQKETNINGKVDKFKDTYILDKDGNKIKQLK